MLWYARQQDAVKAREKAATEMAALTVALEAAQAEVRSAEAKLETLRTEHYAAGDALHEKQGAFYAANAEVSRLEQQLAFARESETRLTQQVAQLTEAVAGVEAQQAVLSDESVQAEDALAAALAAREQAAADEQSAQAALPAHEEAVAEAGRVLTEAQNQIAQTEQALRVAETRRDAVTRTLAGVDERRERLQNELAGLSQPGPDPVAQVTEQLEQERAELASKEAALSQLQAIVQELQERQRETSAAWQAQSRELAELEAREQALSALQARIGHGQDIERWLDERGLAHVRRLFQALDIESGWEDALEAVLRERLEALEVASLDDVAAWTAGEALPRRLSAFARGVSHDSLSPASDALIGKLRFRDAAVARVLQDGLHGIRCRADLPGALAERASLGVGEAFVTPQGHIVTAQGVSFFAPDSELHGVLARQRELEALCAVLEPARTAAADARAALDTVEHDLKTRQIEYHQESQALTSQQRRTYDLELELLQLRQAAEAAAARRAQIEAEQAELAAQHDAEQGQLMALQSEIADLQSRLHDEMDRREALRHARNEAEVSLARGRERVRAAERATQEAEFAARSCRDRQAELGRRGAALAAQIAQQQGLLAQLSSERQSIDWTPVEEALQRQLAERGRAEQALAAARDRLEALGADLRAGDEARLVAEQKLEPARAKIQDMQLKEQAAALAEQQFAEQLAEAHADVTTLPDTLKAWGSARTLPAEIERIQKAVAELGPVNLAALDELVAAKERKEYLDRQAADLTEAMTTLEAAIRQIDRESRELLQQTFDAVNANFGKLFPALFGGGRANLLLTGEEILDSGVQVIAQPPGKRNTSIHLLSGGEKALTAISLVFALFQLNPAPFCLLDEVDAPLDDPNTERFCKMVDQMSSETQFLFISHNKITMEMANQLVGITMPEAGVSRVVAVDIAEALELAENAPVAAAAD
jgi:chromosome segregation protein